MADITMCLNEECPASRECYRKNAKADYGQSFALFDYDEKVDGEFYCENFIEMQNKTAYLQNK